LTAGNFPADGLKRMTNGQGDVLAAYALDPEGTHLARERGGALSYLGLSPHTDVTFSLSGQGADRWRFPLKLKNTCALRINMH